MVERIEVNFIHPDGRVETVLGAPGDTVMDVALDNGIAEIVAQCGGGCTCCTCHCWIADDWLPRVDPPDADELALLEYAWGRNASSRLSCQVYLRAEHSGVVVHLPAEQA